MAQPKTGKAKQKWQPGATVSVGGRPYVVKYQEADAPKGESRAWVIATADGSRTYRWRAFRGLELISGQELIRPRRRRKAGAAAPVQPQAAPTGATPPPPANNGLLAFLVEDLVEHPRKDSKEFLSKVLGFFGLNQGTTPPTS